MTSLSSHSGDGAHKNGITEEKVEQLETANNTETVTDKAIQQPPDLQKMPEKTGALASADAGVTPVGGMPEDVTAAPKPDLVVAPPAGNDPPHSEHTENDTPGTENPAKSDPAKSVEGVLNDQQVAANAGQPAVESAPVEVKQDAPEKAPEDDDELAQIQKELASTEPAKPVDTETVPPQGKKDESSEKAGGNDVEMEQTELLDQTTPKEPALPTNKNEDSANKEDGKVSEPMDIDEKVEKETENKNENAEAKAQSGEDDAVMKESCVTDEVGGKNETSETASASTVSESAPEPKLGDGVTTDDSEKVSAAVDDAKPQLEQDATDATNAEKEGASQPEGSEPQKPSDGAKEDGATDKTKSEENEKDEKDSENEQEEEEKVPLLERPTELSGRRARKAVERFSESGTPETKRGSLPLEQGRGAKLADCPVVNTNIGSGAPEQVHALHQVIFGRQGRPHEFRRNLRQFSGFAFRPEEPAYAKKRDSLLRYRLDALRSLSHLLNLETKSKSREELAQGVLDFLMEPTPTDTVVEPTKKRATKVPRKGARASSRRSAAAEEEEEEEEDEDEEDEEDEEEEEETPKKAPSKRTPARRATKTPAKKTPAKKAAAKRTPAKRTPAAKTPAKTAGRKTPARQAAKRKRAADVSASEEEEEEEAAPPVSKRAKTGRAPPRSRR